MSTHRVIHGSLTQLQYCISLVMLTSVWHKFSHLMKSSNVYPCWVYKNWKQMHLKRNHKTKVVSFKVSFACTRKQCILFTTKRLFLIFA